MTHSDNRISANRNDNWRLPWCNRTGSWYAGSWWVAVLHRSCSACNGTCLGSGSYSSPDKLSGFYWLRWRYPICSYPFPGLHRGSSPRLNCKGASTGSWWAYCALRSNKCRRFRMNLAFANICSWWFRLLSGSQDCLFSWLRGPSWRGSCSGSFQEIRRELPWWLLGWCMKYLWHIWNGLFLRWCWLRGSVPMHLHSALPSASLSLSMFRSVWPANPFPEYRSPSCTDSIRPLHGLHPASSCTLGHWG